MTTIEANLTNKTYASKYAKTYPMCDINKNPYMSPINIDTEDVRICSKMCQLKTNYKASKCNVIRDESGLLTIGYGKSDSYITYKTGKTSKYMLYKILPNINAIHLINGIRHDMELHLYHKNSIGEIIIVAILVNINDSFSDSQDFFSQFIPKLKYNETNQQDYSIDVATNWNVKNALPTLRSFYTYQGSLFYTPCTTGITWIIYENIVNINRSDYDILREKIAFIFTIEPFPLNKKNNDTVLKTAPKRYVYYNNDINVGTSAQTKGKIYIKCNKIKKAGENSNAKQDSKGVNSMMMDDKTTNDQTTDTLSYWESTQWLTIKYMIIWVVAIIICVWLVVPSLNYSFEYNKALYKIVNEPLEIKNTFGINPDNYAYDSTINNEQLRTMVTNYVSQTTNSRFDLSCDTWFNEWIMKIPYMIGHSLDSYFVRNRNNQ